MPRGRLPQLDVLRGIAVLMVMLYHYPYYAIFRFGWIGVDLFFVLSGFLISGLLFSEWTEHGAISVGHFYLRRSFKIYPAFYFFLFTATWAYAAVQPAFWEHPIISVRNEIFFLQDYLPHIWPHTWSLAVEEQFYLLLPVLLIIIAKVSPPTRPFVFVPVVVIGSTILCSCFRIASHPAAPEDVRWAFHYRADALFAGVGLGYLFHFKKLQFLRVSRPWLLPLALALLLPAVMCTTARYASWVLTCNVLAFSALLLWTVPRAAPAWTKSLERIGVYSYSIYLWHALMAVIFRGNFTRHLLLLVPYIVASIAFGAYMAKVVEVPALAYRDRLFPTRNKAKSDSQAISVVSVSAENAVS